MDRRAFLRFGAAALAGLALPAGLAGAGVRDAARFSPGPGFRWAAVEGAPVVAGGVVEIEMRALFMGARAWFDPAGVRVEPGAVIRWVNVERVTHTATAYHPSVDRRPRRIPAEAAPWHSGYLSRPGAVYETRLTVPGVYDYYCSPHEGSGMVGRIVVGEPSPDELPAYAARRGPPAEPEPGLRPLPMRALRMLPPVELILERGAVRLRG